MKRFPPALTGLTGFLHGADYNPEQWLETPGVIDDDFRWMAEAGLNAASIAIFAWSSLEPEEGRFTFGWLDDIMDRMARQNMAAVLATPSAARPAWLAKAYPECMRVNARRERTAFSERRNHCYTSPIYRDKVRRINGELARRYASHPALRLWHLGNEYSGDCFCGLCASAFRTWLRHKYQDDLDALNRAWWTAFWSHTYRSWEEIDPPDGTIDWDANARFEKSVNGLLLDWKRFSQDQILDFMRTEASAVRLHDPHTPLTTNFLGLEHRFDAARFAADLDVASWDSYPAWHVHPGDTLTACRAAMEHNYFRSLKGGRPHLLMESAPSHSNWIAGGKPKRPGMHVLASLQAVAHGADGVAYFQWRQSRGSAEKYHGAVIPHANTTDTRIFREIQDTSRRLARLSGIAGCGTPARSALIYDQENQWALDGVHGFKDSQWRDLKKYAETCVRHHHGLWRSAVNIDVISMDASFSPYRLLAAPMLYMLRPGVAGRLESFVHNGGTLVLTYLSGQADENDLCFLGGFPGPLRALAGLWAEETDCIQPHETQALRFTPGSGWDGVFEAEDFCQILRLEGASALAVYENGFYAGTPAITVHPQGKGRTYYLGARTGTGFLDAFYVQALAQAGVPRLIRAPLPLGVSVSSRTDGVVEHVFLLNFSPEEAVLDLRGEDLTGDDGPLPDHQTLAPYEALIAHRPLRD